MKQTKPSPYVMAQTKQNWATRLMHFILGQKKRPTHTKATKMEEPSASSPCKSVALAKKNVRKHIPTWDEQE